MWLSTAGTVSKKFKRNSNFERHTRIDLLVVFVAGGVVFTFVRRNGSTGRCRSIKLNIAVAGHPLPFGLHVKWTIGLYLAECLECVSVR